MVCADNQCAMERFYLQCGNDSAREKRIIPLIGDVVTVGRKELLSAHISRNHAAFRRQGDGWTVTCLGQNNMVMNGNVLVRDVEYPLILESEIKFTERDVNVYKLKVARAKGGRHHASTSTEAHKKLRQETESSSAVAGNMRNEYIELEQQLRGSEALQIQLMEERDQMHQSLQNQQTELEEKYQQEKAQLEEKFQSGALAQQAMLDEKEVLAQKLKEEVSKLQTQLEEERKALEERLKQEEDRNRALQEKENELRQLAEEKATLEERQEEERQRLQKQLQDTELYKEELRQQVEAKNSAIQAKEAEYLQAEEEKQRLANQLAEERLSREEEKYRLQEQMMHAKSQEQNELKEAIDALETQKKNLMAELSSSATDFSEAKKKMVASVSTALEDEFECAICNELFINAVVLHCSHTFCKYCIDRWKKNKKNCPSCRLPITSESRSLVVDNFIEKIVPTLSDEMKKKRAELVAERSAILKAEAQAAAANVANRGNSGRGRGRANRARGNQSGPRQRNERQSQSQQGQSNEPAQTSANAAGAETVIDVTSDSSDGSNDYLSDSSSVSGDEDVYYGGYGRCFNCGRRGHWANGCPESYLF